MSLALLLDEDSQAKFLVNLLRAAGHDIRTINEAGIGGAADDVVLDYAAQQRRVLLTRNCNDFLDLHQSITTHFGILAVYQDAEPDKNMSYQAIAAAIGNLEASGVPMANQFIVLNQWNY
ncbi:DUF5615 family PIN-like protein [Nodosilinea nodulosa]|uniref:DUF5615 family PIN-like protein n=1 Tax=Nodosilinea nodulosa TaxID=416001 RepID=UPI001CEC10F1|nr:DUF5615 family PIN-like protein [Nodosilinea nodulosa]